MIGMEEARVLAALLDTAADALGRAIRPMELLERRGPEAADLMRRVDKELDAVVEDGPKVARALRAIARQFEREQT